MLSGHKFLLRYELRCSGEPSGIRGGEPVFIDTEYETWK